MSHTATDFTKTLVTADVASPRSSDDLENGRDVDEPLLFARKQPWWQRMALGARRGASYHTREEAVLLSTLADRKAARCSRRRRSVLNYCVFSGISGLTVLAFLMIVNLLLGVANIIWAADVDEIFKNWGSPGTSTEGLAWYPTNFLRDVRPIQCHSHNDYWRKVPLFSALRAGCIGVEADVWLFDDDLYVGHNPAALTRNRTFESLYVQPLMEVLEHQNPLTDFYNSTSHGVFDVDPDQTLTLLVDVKTSGEATWRVVVEQLQPLRDRGWLSFVEDGTVHVRPITVVATGNAPFDVVTANETYRDAFFDAPLDTMWEDEAGRPGSVPAPLAPELATRDLGQGRSGVTATTDYSALNSYYASVNFHRAVGYIWRGRMTESQIDIIRGQVRGAHRRGLKVRYWDLPSWPLGLRNHIWDVLVKEGVDLLNVDDLRAASKQLW